MGANAQSTSSDAFTGVALLIDDDDSVRVGVRMVLEVLGFEVLEARDGEAALDALRARRGEVVAALLDMTLPGLSGIETFRGLRSIREDLPVIVNSGRDENDAMARLGAEKNVSFLSKPFGLNELSDELKKVLGQRRV